MNIKIMGFAFILVSMTLGCAGTVDTDRQKSVQGAETAQGTETVQGANTVDGANSDSYDPDEVTCKRIAKVGTRFKTKVCATNREWKASEESAGRTTEEIQRRSKLGRS
jgi:hypothetical protein